jgi:hypothetical protein
MNDCRGYHMNEERWIREGDNRGSSQQGVETLRVSSVGYPFFVLFLYQLITDRLLLVLESPVKSGFLPSGALTGL